VRPRNIGHLLFGVWLILMAFTFPGAPIELKFSAVPVMLGLILIASGVCTLLDI
jgi:hypothetical protein